MVRVGARQRNSWRPSAGWFVRGRRPELGKRRRKAISRRACGQATDTSCATTACQAVFMGLLTRRSGQRALDQVSGKARRNQASKAAALGRRRHSGDLSQCGELSQNAAAANAVVRHAPVEVALERYPPCQDVRLSKPECLPGLIHPFLFTSTERPCSGADYEPTVGGSTVLCRFH